MSSKFVFASSFTCTVTFSELDLELICIISTTSQIWYFSLFSIFTVFLNVQFSQIYGINSMYFS